MGTKTGQGATVTEENGLQKIKKRQIRNILIYLLPPVLSAALPIVTMPLFTRALTPQDFGAYALAQAYGLFVMGLVNMGLTTAYERNFFEYRDSTKNQAKLLYSILLCTFSTFFLSMLGTWMARNLLSNWIIGDNQYSLLLFWSACSVCLVSFKQYFLLYFRNTEDAMSYAKYSMDEMVLNTAFSMLLVLGFHVGVIGLALGQCFGSLIVLAILCLRFIRRLAPALAWSPLRNSLSLALPLTPLSLFKVLGTQADKYLLGLLGSLGGVGLYSIGQKFGYLVFTWTTALQNVFSPQVYQQMFSLSREDGRKSIGIYLTPFAYLSVGGSLGMALFAQEVITLLTPSNYHGASDAATVLALYYGILFFGKIPQLTYARKTYVTAALSFGSTFLTFICCVVGIKFLGMMGAAWGLLVAGLASSAIGFLLSQRYYFIQWEKTRLTAIFGYLFGAAFLVLFLRYREFGIISLIAVKLLLVLGYLGIGKSIGVLSRKNILALLQVFMFQSNAPKSKL